MSDRMSLEEKCINTIRFLAADAIEKAKSGHPGMPMGAAAAAYHPLDAAPEAQPGRSALGRTATASSCPPGTPRCSSMPSSI